MKYSLAWMKDHIDGTLPSVEEVRRIVTMNAFEVEEIETHGSDTVFDVKVLPDRAHDALSHRGMAREIAALLGLGTHARAGIAQKNAPSRSEGVANVRVTIEDSSLCSRYIGVRVDGASVAPSPAWLTEKLERVGQRSINAIVDLTNYVLFDIGQPMHAFDAAKVKGGITVRLAKKGEAMTTLDGRSLVLTGTETVIADDEAVLALAGVKGGKKAEVDAKTTDIILESANFDPVRTRRTSTLHGIKTDASKRYENGITSAFAEEGMRLILSSLAEVLPGARIGAWTDAYPREERWEYLVGVTLHEVNDLLGTQMSEKDLKEILQRLKYSMRETTLMREISDAATLVGKAYKNPSAMRTDAPQAFSCSSLVSYVFARAGVWMPSVSVDKYVYGAPVDAKDARPGDLVFSNTGEGKVYRETLDVRSGEPVPEGVDHVGILLEGGKVLHASARTGGVVIEAISASPSFATVVGYRRIVDDPSEKRFVVTVPRERIDLRMPCDLIEDIGRHYGYDRIAPMLPKDVVGKGTMSPALDLANRIRRALAPLGFSEIFTSSFAKKGEGTVEVLNPVGDDRPFLRQDLSMNVAAALVLNNYNAPLIGIDGVRVFEIGHVFMEGGRERYRLAIGYLPANKKEAKVAKESLAGVHERVEKAVGVRLASIAAAAPAHVYKGLAFPGEVDEIDLDAALESYEPLAGDPFLEPMGRDVRYASLSAYPFIVRDIALFVPANEDERVPEEIIRSAGGKLVVRLSRFDRFQKPGEDRVSYAYRLVFQSFERTLTDEEVATEMERVYGACRAKGWEVR